MTPGAQPPDPDEDPDETELVFRRVMAYATDEAWELQVDEAALAAMYDVLHLGRRRTRDRRCRPWCWRDVPPTGASNRNRRPPPDGPTA
jgi:hypothetical protein